MPVENVVGDMVDALAKQVPAERREEFVGLMKKITRLDTLKGLTVDGIAKHFTVAEFDAMTKFYSSTEGEAIMKKPCHASLPEGLQPLPSGGSKSSGLRSVVPHKSGLPGASEEHRGATAGRTLVQRAARVWRVRHRSPS